MGQKNRNYCLNKKPFMNAKPIRKCVVYKNLMTFMFCSNLMCISDQHIQIPIQSMIEEQDERKIDSKMTW
jgi:hypothetical protein